MSALFAIKGIQGSALRCLKFKKPDSTFIYSFLPNTKSYQLLHFIPNCKHSNLKSFPSSYNLTSSFIYSNINFLLLFHLWTYPRCKFLKILTILYWFLIPGTWNMCSRKLLLNKVHSTYALLSRTWRLCLVITPNWFHSTEQIISNRILIIINFFHEDQCHVNLAINSSLPLFLYVKWVVCIWYI